MSRTALAALMTLMLVVVGFAVVVPTAYAVKCDTDPTGKDCPEPPKCDPKTEECFICHNIGGPRDLGANCDMTGTCQFTFEDEGIQTTLLVTAPHYLGIIIGFNQDSAGAMAAHLAHGDGFVITEFIPALHLASDGQNHQAANVECLAARATTTQPPEPGN